MLPSYLGETVLSSPPPPVQDVVRAIGEGKDQFVELAVMNGG